MSSLTIRSESLLSVLMDGFFSGGATMCISWFDVEESNLVIAFPVVLDSMTNTDFSGIFASNSDTPALDVLKTNDWTGDFSHTRSVCQHACSAALLVCIYSDSRFYSYSFCCFVCLIVSWI